MSILDHNRQNLLVTHALLTGLTPLVPIPFVDDHIYAYFMRSLVQRLGTAHGKTFSATEMETLSAQKGRGCALGFLGSVLLYPVKKVLRKIFFFLEWKRAVDTMSHTYYYGYLIDAALSEGWLNAHGAPRIRTAIDAVLLRTNTSLVTRAFYGVVSQSKGILSSAGQLLTRTLDNNKARPSQAKVAQAVAGVEEQGKAKLGGLTDQVQAVIGSLPVEHFEKLKQELAAELTRQPTTGATNI
jgi:hypothetical protein